MQGFVEPDHYNNPYKLVIRQQPVHSRMCGIGERVDRRPIDPPPVVQIKINSTKEDVESLSSLSSYLFLIAVLVPADADDEEQLNILLHSKLTVGRTVSSLYILRDLDGSEGAFFVFSDISVRAEGNYRLRMCLFNIKETFVNYNQSVLTEPFTVYSAKSFPGMYRSCPLVQNFAKQGLKIRIRKESGPRPSRYRSTKRSKISRKQSHTSEEEEYEFDEELEDEYNSIESSPNITIPTDDDTEMKLSNKRRLSLSYLLDYNENIPTTTKSPIEHYKLAPISFPTTTTTPPPTTYHSPNNNNSNSDLTKFHDDAYLDHSIDLPPIQKHFNLPPIHQHFHFHSRQHQY